jgi:hypothetical protein
MARLTRRHKQAAGAALALACCLPSARRATAGDLTAQAARIAREEVRRLGEGYTARIDGRRHIVYVSALDDEHLDKTLRLLTAFTDAYRRTLPAATPAWNLTVVLPTVKDYRKGKLPFKGCAGFYDPSERRLVSIDRGRTLVHEFTHALHHADTAAAKQVHPVWVCEGLATLFEASRITPAGLVPQVDRRLPALQRALKDDKAIPLRRLLAMDSEAFRKDAELAYAEVRYVMYYLHARGCLADWYRRYKAAFLRDRNGAKALEVALGGRLFQIEPQWRQWVLQLRVPSSERRVQQGRLGLQMKKGTRGVKVVGLVPGGAAEIAGRIHVNDVIEAFNGHEVTHPGELIGAIRSARALQTVEVRLRRGGRTMTVAQPLGIPSARLAAPR